MALLHLDGERGQPVRVRNDDDEDLWHVVAVRQDASSKFRVMQLHSCSVGGFSAFLPDTVLVQPCNVFLPICSSV